MGKHNEEMLTIEKLEKEIKQKKQKLKIPCSHTTKRGKFKFAFKEDEDALVKCWECGARFSMREISDHEINKAYMILHSVINQIKAFSNDPVDDAEAIIRLGKLDYKLSFEIDQLKELYNKTIHEYGKKDNKKKKNGGNYDNFGYYGAAGLGFNKKKNRY